MRSPITKFLQQYFYFSKRDRNAITVLVVVLIFAIAINEIVKSLPQKSEYNYYELAKEFEAWEREQKYTQTGYKSLFTFNPNTISEQKLDSLLLSDYIVNNLINYRKAGGIFSEASDFKKIYGMNDSIYNRIEQYIIISEDKEIKNIVEVKTKPTLSGFFDPNRADKEKLMNFGFNQFQANNLISYRNNGGHINKPIELMRIYGIDSTFYFEIEKHISIKETVVEGGKLSSIQKKSIIELNSADSTQLIQLKGIGPVFAGRIVKYRDLLGGFYSEAQLLEVYNFPEETYLDIKEYLKVDTSFVKKMRINFDDYAGLIRHPYMNNEQVDALLEYRNVNGAIKNETELTKLNAFKTMPMSKLRPYISFQ